MKIDSEQLKEILCKANRITPNAKIKFKGKSWVSATEESDSHEFTYIEIDIIPYDAKLIAYGMDFGYSNDPSTLVSVYTLEHNLYIKELSFCGR